MHRVKSLSLCVLILILLPITVDAQKLDSDLRSAAKKGKLEKIQTLVRDGAAVNSIDKKGRTALMFAAEKGHLEVVNFLISHKADVLIADKNGETALAKAEREKREGIIPVLAFETAKTLNTIEAFESFVDEYPNSEYISSARMTIDSLEWEWTLQANTLGAYWIYINLPTEGLKEHLTLAKEHFDQALRCAQSISTDSLIQYIEKAIQPIHIRDIILRSRYDENSINMNVNGVELESTSRKIVLDSITYTLTAQKLIEEDKIVEVAVYAREGDVGPGDIYSGEIGTCLFEFENFTSLPVENPIGFELITINIMQPQTTFLIVADRVYIFNE